MEHSDTILNIIGSLAIVVTYYFIFKKSLWNFNNGYSLSNFSTKSNIIIAFVFVTSLRIISFIPTIIIILLVALVSFIGLYKYLDAQNKTKNKDKLGLQAFYISEINKAQKISYLRALLTLIAIVFLLLDI